MLECLVLGDSIAQGVGQARPDCETTARVGINSGAYVNTLFPLASRVAHTAVISLGVNDDPSMDTIDNIRQVRRSLKVESVVWLLPGLKDNVRAAIRTVAAENGDQLVDTKPQAGPDHLHPNGAGYRLIAEETISRTGGEVPDTQVAFAPVPLSSTARERIAAGPGEGGNLAQYRRHVVFRGKLQQMADLRLQLAHQQAGYTRWPPANATFAAMPPTNYAFGAMSPTRTAMVTPAPAKSAPAKATPAKSSRGTPAKFTPAKFTPAKITPAKITPAKITPVKATPARATPVSAKAMPAHRTTHVTAPSGQ